MSMTLKSAGLTRLTLTMLLTLALPQFLFGDASAMRIEGKGFAPGEGFRLRVEGPSGEYRVEFSDDLETWLPLETFLLSRVTGGETELADAENEDRRARFYRAVGILIGADFHLTGRYGGPVAQLLAEADETVLAALGIDFEPLAPDAIPAAVDLASAERNVRVYAAVLAALSLLGEAIDHAENQETAISGTTKVAESEAVGLVLQASTEISGTTRVAASEAVFGKYDPLDLANALIADLASGQLDGTDANGDPVRIGGTDDFLPAHVTGDLVDSLQLFAESAPGLENVVFEVGPDGSLAAIVGADWDAFHWNGADWR